MTVLTTIIILAFFGIAVLPAVLVGALVFIDWLRA